jgi:regulator of protease activity HflC (stomatin/prohibitin superfamily)
MSSCLISLERRGTRGPILGDWWAEASKPFPKSQNRHRLGLAPSQLLSSHIRTNDLGGSQAASAVVGGRELDQFLADKDAVAKELETMVRQRVAALGLEVISVGIRDVILPGDMKDLMNKVTEAKKAAEANLIVRREETAAMRSQANTAKVLEGNPTLMRLRELEVLEKVATSGKLNVVLGEKGLAERVVNLL